MGFLPEEIINGAEEELAKAGFVEVVQQMRDDLAPVVSARRPV